MVKKVKCPDCGKNNSIPSGVVGVLCSCKKVKLKINGIKLKGKFKVFKI